MDEDFLCALMTATIYEHLHVHHLTVSDQQVCMPRARPGPWGDGVTEARIGQEGKNESKVTQP